MQDIFRNEQIHSILVSRASIIKYHILGGLKQQKSLSPGPGDQKSAMKGSVWPCFSNTSRKKSFLVSFTGGSS